MKRKHIPWVVLILLILAGLYLYNRFGKSGGA